MAPLDGLIGRLSETLADEITGRVRDGFWEAIITVEDAEKREVSFLLGAEECEREMERVALCFSPEQAAIAALRVIARRCQNPPGEQTARVMIELPD